MLSVNTLTDNYSFSRESRTALLRAARIVGFACLLAWFSASGFLSSSPSANRSDTLTLAAFTLLLFGTAVAARGRIARCNHPLAYPLLGAAAGLGTVIPSFVDGLVVTSAICPLITAIGLSVFTLGWGSLFSGQNMEKVIPETIMAQMLMSIIHFTSYFLPPLPETVVRGALLVGSGLMLAIAQKTCHPRQVARERLSRSTPTSAAGRRILVRFIVAINLWSIAINLLYNIYRYCAPLDFVGLSAPAALIEVLFLGLLLIVTSVCAMRDAQLYTIIFATVLLAFLLVPVLGIESSVPFYALFLGFAALSVLTWILSAQICREHYLSPGMVYGCSIGSFLGLQIVLARVAAQDVFSEIASSPVELNALCLVGAFISFVAYQMVFNRRSALWSKQAAGSDETPIVVPDENDTDPRPHSADPFDHWDAFAETYRLTPRESEVLLLFARGRSYERIQEALVISRGTVNYHMANAYRKLGVSSRQDLLDRFDETVRTIKR